MSAWLLPGTLRATGDLGLPGEPQLPVADAPPCRHLGCSLVSLAAPIIHVLAGRRHAALEHQVAVCRGLARSMPASLPPAAVPQLTALASAWLAPPAAGSTSTSRGEPAAIMQVQLQAEAVHLLVSMVGPGRALLPAASASQLLQAVCGLCHWPPSLAGSVAVHELACGCMDLLAQLPQWCPQASKVLLAAAVAAVAAVLAQQQSSSREETLPTTRLLSKLLRALQVLLAEVRRAATQVVAVV